MLGTEGDFNLFATHSLKLPLSPFGIPTSEAIDERRGNVKAPLLSYTTEPISAMVRRPEAERMMMLQLGPSQRASVSALVGERNLLRLRLAHEVDFDDVVDRSYTVLRLLQLAQSDRLALGELDDGNQAFDLPGEGRATARSAFPLVTRTSLPLAHGRSPHGHLDSVLPGRFGSAFSNVVATDGHSEFITATVARTPASLRAQQESTGPETPLRTPRYP